VTKTILLFPLILLAGCSHEEMRQTHEDARKLGQDLKKQMKTADAVVTKEAKEARDKVKDGATKLKGDAEKPK
jgi:hypothetical protein